jgi:hypothetical protein
MMGRGKGGREIKERRKKKMGRRIRREVEKGTKKKGREN